MRVNNNQSNQRTRIFWRGGDTEPGKCLPCKDEDAGYKANTIFLYKRRTSNSIFDSHLILLLFLLLTDVVNGDHSTTTVRHSGFHKSETPRIFPFVAGFDCELWTLCFSDECSLYWPYCPLKIMREKKEKAVQRYMLGTGRNKRQLSEALQMKKLRTCHVLRRREDWWLAVSWRMGADS